VSFSPTTFHRIDPARFTLTIVDPEGLDDLLARLGSRLDAEAAPPVTIEQLPTAIRFTSETWRPILITRVTDALDAEIGAAERERRFRSFS
jgi:hypothetical protein